MSLFITFEGGEGSGKTVQARALYRRLLRLGVPAVLVHEPGGTGVGRRIARWLKWDRSMGLSPVAELLLFNASRAQLVSEVIEPALEAGKVVICDRFADSTMVYQGYGRGLDREMVGRVNNIGTGGLCPALTVLLDIPVDDGFARVAGRTRDRFEREEAAFHRRVREGYLALAAAEPGRWLVIDGRLPRGEVARMVWTRVTATLGNSGRTVSEGHAEVDRD